MRVHRRPRAFGDRGGGRRRRPGGGPVAAYDAAPVVEPRGRDRVHRTDAGAGGDLAVAGVRQVVCLTGREEGITCGGEGGRAREETAEKQ